MNVRILLAAVAFAPAAALAQVSHSRAYITGPVVVPNEPAYVVPAQPAYPSACADLQVYATEHASRQNPRSLTRLNAARAPSA